MAYVEGFTPLGEVLPAIGFVFSTADFGRAFFDLLLAWNDREQQDIGNNICLSFTTDDSGYFVWLYPSFERGAVQQTAAQLDASAKSKGPTYEPFLITISTTFCKHFDAHGALRDFLNACEQGSRFQLVALHEPQTGVFKVIPDVLPIDKWHFKVKRHDSLTAQDFEWAYLQHRRRKREQ